MKKIPLHFQILIAMVLGGVLSSMFKSSLSPQSYGKYIEYVGILGDLFLRALKMAIVPLVMSSVMSGIINIGKSENIGRLTAKTMTWYFSTSILAIITGMFFVNLIQPGVGADIGLAEAVDKVQPATLSFRETIVRIIPTNILTALTEPNMLGIIFFSITFALFLTKVDTPLSEPIINGINGVFETMMKMVMWFIKFSPLGIFSIISLQVAKTDDILGLLHRLGIYGLTVLCGLIVHMFITLPLLMWIVGRVNPVRHFRNMSFPLLTAFSTSSSAATLPLTMDALVNKAKVSPRVTNFVIPVGSTLNMDGTALYECVAVMFIAQAYGRHLGIEQQLIVVFTALLATTGAAAIPMAGLFMMSIILTAVGLPLEGVGLILAIDRILDMCRTTVNTWSDTCGTVAIAKTEKEELNC